MVCLNKNISFNVNTLKLSIVSNVNCFVQNALEFYLSEDKIIKVQNKLEKQIKSLFYNDHFVYLNMNNNLCTHKFKRGKSDGFFCCKKITSNGNKKNYVCTKHNKEHVPKKRNNNINVVNIINDTKDKFLQNNSILRNLSKVKKVKKNKKLRKIFICNSGKIDFKSIFKLLLV